MIGTLLGKYKILRLLGAGGMGAVYLGEHVMLKQLRAVKVLLEEHTRNPQLVARFMGEARTVAAIKNRNVVAIDDVGQLENGVCYMVLEYLEGGTLGRYIRSQGGPIPLLTVVKIVAQIAYALQAAHDRGVVHRDLKPENIYLTDGDELRVVVLDWGIALIAQELRSGSVTRTGSLMGTPQYMAPEQHRGERVGTPADIYALGAILYELVTGGWMPYLDEHSRKEDYLDLTQSEIYLRQMTRPPFYPRRRVPALSDEIAALVLSALDRDPARRPASPRALALRLAELVPGDGYHPDGLEIVRAVAKPLLDASMLLDTLRSSKPAIATNAKLPATRYQLGEKLGAGGMAEVFTGTVAGAEGFQRQVAIKRVMSGLSGDAGFARMFVEEARIMSRLDHPNIVGVLAFDRDPEGRLFLVMEYVDGRDLAALAETGRLPISVTIFILIEILQGLGYAHDFPDPTGEIQGVVHRDMSPHNVLLAWTGVVKVSDFGIAKVFAESGASRSISVKGKPQYMSPEQVNAEPLDGRSDLFAVGVVGHELLTGTSLFAGTHREAMAQVMFRDIPRPSSVRADVPAAVESVVMKLLERDRARRYANAEQAIEDLARCADAPRNGRRELSRLMVERFPELAQARSKRARDSDRTMAPPARAASPNPAPAQEPAPAQAPGAQAPVTVPLRYPAPMQDPVPEQVPSAAPAPIWAPVPVPPQAPLAAQVPVLALPMSTLGSSASQLMRRPPGPRSRRRLWVAIGCGIAIGSVVGAGIWAADRADGGAGADEGSVAILMTDAGLIDAATARNAAADPKARIDAPIDAAALVAGPIDASIMVVSSPDAAARSVMASDAAVAVATSPDASRIAPRYATPAVIVGAGARAPAPAASPNPAVRQVPVGDLVIAIDPYAEVWLDGRPLGSTPIRMKVAVGSHRILLVNKDMDIRKTVTVTITTEKQTHIEETW